VNWPAIEWISPTSNSLPDGGRSIIVYWLLRFIDHFIVFVKSRHSFLWFFIVFQRFYRSFISSVVQIFFFRYLFTYYCSWGHELVLVGGCKLVTISQEFYIWCTNNMNYCGAHHVLADLWSHDSHMIFWNDILETSLVPSWNSRCETSI
jgi:hypothetical protein